MYTWLPAFTVLHSTTVTFCITLDIMACKPGDECLEACGNIEGCSQHALPLLVFTLLPQGIYIIKF